MLARQTNEVKGSTCCLTFADVRSRVTRGPEAGQVGPSLTPLRHSQLRWWHKRASSSEARGLTTVAGKAE